MNIPHIARSRHLLTLVAAFLAAGSIVAPAEAQRNSKLEVGSKAPSPYFAGAKVVGGNAPPAAFQEGKTYVVEFWATWCGPCRKAIPHLNGLAETLKRKGVQVIGVSSEGPKVVGDFVKKRGSGMSYTVIADPDKSYSKAWMQAAKQKYIPTAFIVGPTGRIAYIGSPSSEQFDRILHLCADGKYDPVLYEKAEPLLNGAEKSITTRDWSQAHRQLDKVLEIDNWVFSDQMLRKYKLMMIEQNDSDGADAYLSQQIRGYSTKPDVLADIARMVVSDPEVTNRNMELADQAVAALAVAKGDRDPDVLEVVALVAYKRGDIDGAVRNQFQAWMAAEPDFKPDYKYVLDQYKAEQNADRGTGTRGRGRR